MPCLLLPPSGSEDRQWVGFRSRSIFAEWNVQESWGGGGRGERLSRGIDE